MNRSLGPLLSAFLLCCGGAGTKPANTPVVLKQPFLKQHPNPNIPVKQVKVDCLASRQSKSRTFSAGTRLEQILTWYIERTCLPVIAEHAVKTTLLKQTTATPEYATPTELGKWLMQMLIAHGKAPVIAGNILILLDDSSSVIAYTPIEPPFRPRVTYPATQLEKDIANGINQKSEFHYTIKKSLWNRVLVDPLVIKGARIVPSIRNGRPRGFKLYSIRPRSLFAKLGIKNGDTIHSINGFSLKTMSEGLEVSKKLQGTRSAKVGLTRRGQEILLEYTIVD